MNVKIIDDKELWDDFIDKSSYGLLFHKWDFLKIAEKHTGYKLLLYGIYNSESLVCLFPLFFKKINVVKMIISPPPLSGVPYLGFVMSPEYNLLRQSKKEKYLNTVVDEINTEINNLSPHYVRISLMPNFMDVRPFTWNDYRADEHFTYVIDLNQSLDGIWGGFGRQIRKKATACGQLDLKLVKSDDITSFYEIEEQRYKDQGLKSPIISKKYLDELIKTYPESIELYYLCESDGGIIGIHLICKYKDRFMLWMGSTKPDKNIHANEYMAWELIKQAKDEGYQKFEMSGAGIKRLCEFKSKFNPTLEFNFNISKKKYLGVIAEWGYFNLIKRRF